jgi:hypothetical protein
MKENLPMRMMTCLLSVLALLFAASPGTNPAGANVSAATIQSDAPQITGVRRQGKKLFVTGDHFDLGAVILVNGEPQKTANDETTPTTLLIAKKAGKLIGPNDVVNVEVQNPDGQTSTHTKFFNGTTLTQADTGKTFTLAVHEKFLISLDTHYEWSWSFSNPEAFQPVIVLLPLLGVQGVYEAEAAGSYTLTAKGEPFCAKQDPPCTLPTQLVEIKLTVQ